MWPRRKHKEKKAGIPVSLWSYAVGGDEAVKQMKIRLGLPLVPKAIKDKQPAPAPVSTPTTSAVTPKPPSPTVETGNNMGHAHSTPRSGKKNQKQNQHQHQKSLPALPTACETCGHAAEPAAPTSILTTGNANTNVSGNATAHANEHVVPSSAPSVAVATAAAVPVEDLSEQDMMLVEMKTANASTSWKDIAAVLALENKDIKGLVARWKELQALGWGNGAVPAGPAVVKNAPPPPPPAPPSTAGAAWPAPKGRGSFSAGGYGAPTSPVYQSSNQQQNRQRQPSPEPESQPQTQTQQVDSAGRKVRILDDQGIFTIDELERLWKIIMKDEQRRWLRVASKFGDETGVLLHPEDVREAFEED